MGLFNVFALASLVPTAKQNHQHGAIQSKVNPVPWTEINFHFLDPFPHGTAMAGVSFFHPPNAGQYGRFSSDILQTIQPVRKGGMATFRRVEPGFFLVGNHSAIVC